MAKEPTLLLEELLNRIGGDREFAMELLSEWVDGLTRELTELDQAIEKKDLEGLRHKAHSLKGSALNLSAKEFARLASLCENAARDGDLEAVRVTLPLLNEEAETLLSIIPGLS